MKVKDLLKLDIDIDVYDDICDELEIAFVGPAQLTDEGYAEFKDVLEAEVLMNEIDGYCVVICDDVPEWHKKLKLVTRLFHSLAGYCSEKDYDRWFKDVE